MQGGTGGEGQEEGQEDMHTRGRRAGGKGQEDMHAEEERAGGKGQEDMHTESDHDNRYTNDHDN